MKANGGRKLIEVAWAVGPTGPRDHDTPARRASLEFASIMSYFLAPDSVMTIEDALGLVARLSESRETQVFLRRCHERLQGIEARGRRLATPGNQPLGRREIFNDLCRRVVFANDTDALAFSQSLHGDPRLARETWGQFHSVCLGAYHLLKRLDEYIHTNNLYPRPRRDSLCIFCRTTTGRFAVEHVIPESLENETSLLPRGYVCAECNGAFSGCEQALLASLPLGLLKVFAVFLDKQGKFPSFKHEAMHFEKTSPNSMRSLGTQGRRSRIREEPQGAGQVRLKMPQLSQKIDHIAFSRVFAKMALGVIAIEQGRVEALDPKYDSVRRFARQGGTFANVLVLHGQVKPERGATITWQSAQTGTLWQANILGAVFTMGLEPNDSVPDRPVVMAEHDMLWDLRVPPSKAATATGVPSSKRTP
jgi:hypothetical protein